MLKPSDLAPAWRGAVPVLCVSSRGPFDEAATLMLSQTLDRHGLRLSLPILDVDAEALGQAFATWSGGRVRLT